MRIVADWKIPLLQESFGALGEVHRVPTHEISSSAVRQADALLVRSETRVEASLLRDSRVRFLGTPTSGIDHVDLDYVKDRGIAFASAPGCNATSVAEYVAAALLTLSRRWDWELPGCRLGVVGCGQIGSRVRRMGEALGMQVLANDPPLARTGEPGLVELEALYDCDVITLHVPLEREGRDPTFHLFNQKRLARLNRRTVLINTSRGPVVDNQALKEALASGRLKAAVLDVWEGEPRIDCELLARVEMGTPHIAGYAWDGKVRGTWMVYQEFCNFLGIPPHWKPNDLFAEPSNAWVIPPSSAGAGWVADLVRGAYDIEADGKRLRSLSGLSGAKLEESFRALRKNYPKRREFRLRRVRAARHDLGPMLSQMGFTVG